MSEQQQEQFDAFGKQWREEMMRWSKADLVQALREAWKERNQAIANLNFITHNPGAVAFQLVKSYDPEGLREYMGRFVSWFVDSRYGATLGAELDRKKAGLFNDTNGVMVRMFADFEAFLNQPENEVPVLTKEDWRDIANGRDEATPTGPYLAGFDAGLNSSNELNTHFSHFATPENTKEWERGKKDGENAKLQGLK